MCLLYFYFNPAAKNSEYKLILINSRDEYYNRPTAPASFWDSKKNKVIGGRDNEPGREGGTWLALNQNGQLACLLNILQPHDEISHTKKGRGCLVSDFVCNVSSPKEYLDKIAAEGDQYNGFSLITMNISKNEIAFYTNMNGEKPKSIGSGFHAFGNSPPPKFWEKVIVGSASFKTIIESHKDCSSRNKLLSDLEKMLKDRTKYPVSEQIAMQGKGRPIAQLEELHSIFVEMEDIGYGTRSHTFILINGENKVEYIEKSMISPIDVKKEVNWLTVDETFNLSL